MSVFRIGETLKFPRPELADGEGLLAVGGDLSPERLLLAYANGIFPWYSEGLPVCWWSPDPRLVLYPQKLKVSKSMKQVLRKKEFKVTFDVDFERVILQCKSIERPKQEGTWITNEMTDAYCRLHRLGYAHSVEVWKGKELAGGLYGVSLGRCFFGESMFARISNASKAGLFALVQKLNAQGFGLIDCQVETAHLKSMGGELITRKRFLSKLRKAVKHDSLVGNWSDMKEFSS